MDRGSRTAWREGKGDAAWVNAVLNLRRGPVQLPWVRYGQHSLAHAVISDSQPSDFAPTFPPSHVTEHGAL